MSSSPLAQTQATAPPEPESKYWTPHPTRTQARRLDLVTDMVRVMDLIVSRSGTETGPGRNAAVLSCGLKRSTGNDPVWIPPITEGLMSFQVSGIPTVATIPHLHLLSMHNSLHLGHGLPLVHADVTSAFTPTPHTSTYDSATTETYVDTSTRPPFIIIFIVPTLRSLQRERTMERSTNRITPHLPNTFSTLFRTAVVACQRRHDEH
jgi:hypothetical protein